MKRRRVSLTLCCLLAAALVLAACGSSGGGTGYSANSAAPMSPSADMEMGMDAAEKGMWESSGSGAADSGGSVLADQKIIYTGSLDLETTEFDTTARALTDLAQALGGYLESSSIGGGSRGYRWANYTVRIPSAEFQNFMDQAGSLANETRRSTDLENITEVYYDTQGRLKTQQIKLERLQSLLAQAENMEDIITLESAISETEWQIENLSGTLRHYDALVDFSTVEVSLSEVYKFSETEDAPASFAERLFGAMGRGWRSFVDAVEELLVSLAYLWIYILALGAILAAAIPLSRRALRRRQQRRAARQADAPARETPGDGPNDP